MKVTIPGLSSRHHRRARLVMLLDGCGANQVTLVSAPAGFGKTQLLTDWATTHREQTAWVSLDEDDNDDHRFWAAVLTAIGSCLGPESPVHRLVVPAAPSADPRFLADVASIVDAVTSPIRLVLDDVHELTAAAPLHGLATLVRDRSPGMRLVLSSRTDPPLHVARLRLGGELSEIRAEHLRFSLPEAEAMLAAESVPVRPEQVRLLVEQTEGWAAGLRLAAMSLRDTDDPDGFLADLAGNGRAVSDYLIGEILSRLAPETLEVLRAVCICDRLPAELAVALSLRSDAGEVLDALEHETALVLSSGEGRVWYRIQPLLRAHLRADLTRRRPDLAVALHARAADWFAAHRRPEHALTHARLGGRADQVAALLRRHAIALIATGGHSAVQATIAWLGEHRDGQDNGGDDPWLALVAALAAMEVGRHADVATHLAVAAKGWPADADAELVELRGIVRSRRAAVAGDASGIMQLIEALDARPAGAVPEAQHDLESITRLDQALALAVGGRPHEGRALAETTLGDARRRKQGYLSARALAVLAAVAASQGDYGRMTVLAGQADVELPGPEWASTVGAGMSSALRAYGSLLAAEPARCLDLLARTPGDGADPGGADPGDGLDPVRCALRGAALSDLGRVGEGLAQLAAARGAAQGRPNSPEFPAMIASLEHGAAVAAGHHDQSRAALAWAESVLGTRRADVRLLHARRHITLGRWDAAADALGPVLDGTATAVLPWTVVEAQVLRCQLAVRADRRPQARHELERTLALAGSMSVLRPLAFGPVEVVDLLIRHLGGFGELEAVACRVLDARHAVAPHSGPVRLTARERDVLSMLPTQRSLEEIAVELTVSHSTVKSHVKAIYTKLDASSRREAVTTARRHGLLAATTP
ncbi:MAG: LuxR C-terminal-related transcriptional regulator [Pseudonocardia sp.]|nr:LuxR C-terminal-related transcriptional regulator [Pseudonocardia sp.]